MNIKIIEAQRGQGQVYNTIQELNKTNQSVLSIHLDSLSECDVTDINGECGLFHTIRKAVSPVGDDYLGILIDNDREETEVSIRQVLRIIDITAPDAEIVIITPKEI